MKSTRWGCTAREGGISYPQVRPVGDHRSVSLVVAGATPSGTDRACRSVPHGTGQPACGEGCASTSQRTALGQFRGSNFCRVCSVPLRGGPCDHVVRQIWVIRRSDLWVRYTEGTSYPKKPPGLWATTGLLSSRGWSPSRRQTSLQYPPRGRCKPVSVVKGAKAPFGGGLPSGSLTCGYCFSSSVLLEGDKRSTRRQTLWYVYWSVF